MAVAAMYQTTIGKKVVMAVSGFILVLYVIGHMLGNLKLYMGRDAVGVPAINTYAVFLREVGYPLFPHEVLLWIVRLVLLAAVVLHIWSAYSLTILDRAARPVGYATKRNVQATYASLTMRWGGVIILLFIIYHILHLTIGVKSLNPRFEEGNAYNNLVTGFQNPIVSLFYILAMLALGLHLFHGAWSMFQTLGWNDANRSRFWRNVATIVAAVVTIGNISFPLAVLSGLVK